MKDYKILPMFDKPKSDKTRIVIDYVVLCPACDMQVCYLTEHDIDNYYKYCPRCGHVLAISE